MPTARLKWLLLKHRVERIVKLEQSSINLGDRCIEWLRVDEPDKLLSTAVSDQNRPAEEIDPFWAATWRAAAGLDRFLASFDLQGVRVLELGCGTGQAGIGAALRGANVTFTDAVGLALLVAQLNAWPVWDRAQFRKLKWKDRTLPVLPFPVILGSDLVYDPNLFPLIDACARQHLAKNGRLLLSEPHRHTGDKFAKWLTTTDWQVVEHDVQLDHNRTPIRIFDCRLQAED